MGKWRYSSSHSKFEFEREVNARIHVPAAVTPAKEPWIFIKSESSWVPGAGLDLWRRGISFTLQGSNHDFSVTCIKIESVETRILGYGLDYWGSD
jgi:hypothetical protein